MRAGRCMPLALLGGLLSAATVASAGPTPELLECVPRSIHLCEADKTDCARVPVAEVDGPVVIRVDLRRRKTTTFEGATARSGGSITLVERRDSLVFLSGRDSVRRGESPPQGWTAVIDPGSGRFTASVVANGLGTVLTGTCREIAEGGR